VKEIKKKIISALKEVRVDKLTLADLGFYIDICSKAENLDKSSDSYFTKTLEAMTNGFGSPIQPTIADLKKED
jgi:hypothetical protein